jgi:hypothetical protein
MLLKVSDIETAFSNEKLAYARMKEKFAFLKAKLTNKMKS